MGSTPQPLTPDQARAVYNRIGRLQDWQSFYESKALDDLIAHGEFGSARSVFELGCGTGSFARRLLRDHLRSDASYLGVDVSDTMVGLATARLGEWSDRSRILHTDGELPLPGADASFDRFVANYVFDLLGEDYSARVLEEAGRLLSDGGLLCIASLTRGRSRAERAVTATWGWVWAHTPSLVGGCRPIEVVRMLGSEWSLLHRRVVSSFAIPTEVVIARRSQR
jgi:SAM-dependent methyltransferase